MWPRPSDAMLLLVLASVLSVSAQGQGEEGWLDPYDMINYDATTKTMRKTTETAKYPNVATKRRAHTRGPEEALPAACGDEVQALHSQIEEHKKKIKLISEQPTCHPVFKRFLSRLLKEMQKLGLPSDSSDVHYDAKIKLSKQAMAEIQIVLEGENSLKTGALDSALSEILVDLRPHDYKVWKWRFEDTFGLELDTVLKVMLVVWVMMAIICTQLWSAVSWFVQFHRVLAVCFVISIVWNWFYLYKIAFAEHQNNLVKLDSFNEKCTGVNKIDWTDNLREWFRSTWTLQDDPCKKYYEVLMVNPILLVPPTKAISVTITTFITEPLKHFGQGISEFLRALLKDLPVTLQIPVLLTIVGSILVCMYGCVQAAFQHGITAPLYRHRRDPPPPELDQPQNRLQRIQGRDHLAGEDAQQQAPRPGRLRRNQVHQRRPMSPREQPAKMFVETLQATDPACSEDETDFEQQERRLEAEQNPSSDSDSENQQEMQEESAGVSVSSNAANRPQAKIKLTRSGSTQSKAKPLKLNKSRSQDEPSRDNVELRFRSAGRRPSQTDVQDLEATANVDIVRVSVQETSPTSVE